MYRKYVRILSSKSCQGDSQDSKTSLATSRASSVISKTSVKSEDVNETSDVLVSINCVEYSYGPPRKRLYTWEKDLVKKGKRNKKIRRARRDKSGSRDRKKRSGSRGRKSRSRSRSKERKNRSGSRGRKNRSGSRESKHRSGSRGRKSRSGSRGRSGSQGRRRSKDRSGSRSKSPCRERSPKPKPKPKPKPPKEELAEVLTVTGIQLHVEKNARKHRTDKYDCTETRTDPEDDKKVLSPDLVLRRGDNFLMTIQLDRKFDKKLYDMQIEFLFGEAALVPRGTRVILTVDESTEEKDFPPFEWGAQLVHMADKSATVKVSIPANCIVGEWNLAVKTVPVRKGKDGKDVTFTYENPDDITILFNPWCKHDTVYMAETELLEEYVLNDTGCVYRGSSDTIGAKEWTFGQFEECCFEAALYLLRTSCDGLSKGTMADPVKVVRHLAAIINACDDNGVLVGNWSGNYEGGTSPSKWVGSVKILEQYMKTLEPVQYAQCWVFSCVTTTVCRALGIPCRTVTNFASAHDTDQSNTIDKFHWGGGDGSSDSVWNFHVWNEAWMRRPDLESGMDGWQVIDATPQETSGDVFTCGPCPMTAIKSGNCSVNFDTGFVFSEVNADKVIWVGNKVVEIHKTAVGKRISTKVPDGLPYKDKASLAKLFDDGRLKLHELRRLDLTLEYKHKEGSDQEREAIKMAHKTAINPRANVYDIKPKPLDLEISVSNEVIIGEKLEIEVVVKNPGKEDRKVEKLEVRICPMDYTGHVGDAFTKESYTDLEVTSKGECTKTITITANDYLSHLVEMAMLSIEADAVVAPLEGTERDNPLVTSTEFRFRRPDIDVTSCGKGEVGEPVLFELSFKNPLPCPLTCWDVATESSAGFFNIADYTDPKQPEVAAGGTFKAKIHVKPKKKGQQTVVFSFDCAELKDITGSESVLIG